MTGLFARANALPWGRFLKIGILNIDSTDTAPLVPLVPQGRAGSFSASFSRSFSGGA